MTPSAASSRLAASSKATSALNLSRGRRGKGGGICFSRSSHFFSCNRLRSLKKKNSKQIYLLDFEIKSNNK